MNDRTHEAVLHQAKAMDAGVFEVGLFKPAIDGQPAQPEMLLRTWDLETLLESIPWLKFQNVEGRNIYIRPKGEHSLSLLDDLTANTLEAMKHSGFTPALIIETSPDNFQAWLNHGKALPRDVSTATARALAEKFHGDPGSADWRHFGRLSGFTNRKLSHKLDGGRYPFVRLVHATGEIYPEAKAFVASVESQLATEGAERERQRARFRNSPLLRISGPVKTIGDFRGDAKYRGDGNRIDLAYAIYALSHGVSEDQVRSAIASRDLTKKGTEKRQAEYVERTLTKALHSLRGDERGR